MNELLEAFILDEVLRSFKELDLRSACSALLQALGYTCSRDQDFDDESVDKFVYFSVPKKTYFSTQERAYLSQISILNYMGETTQNELLDTGYAQRKLIFISAELNCTKSSRSEAAHYITQILNKLFDDYIFVVYKHEKNIEFCTCNDMGTVYMSEWFEIKDPILSELMMILQLSPIYLTGVKSIEEYYAEVSFALSREYIKHPESYEYMIYECFPKIIDDIDTKISKEIINQYAVESRNYYPNLYGDDYVFTYDTIVEIEDNDEDWTLFELDDFVPPDAQDELDSEYFDDEPTDEEPEPFDYSAISDEILSDPVKLLEYLESIGKNADGNERTTINGN